MTQKERTQIEQDIFKYGLLQFRKYDEYLISNLIENKITFGSAKNFNDPFDCNLPIYLCSLDEYRKYLWKKFPKRSVENSEYINMRAQMLANFPEVTRADIHHLVYDFRRFSCFNIPKQREHFGNSKFWANYADKHHGICMKFSGNLISTCSKEPKKTITLIPIEYCKTDEIPKFNYFLNDLNGKPEFATQYFFGIKSKHWEDEYEVRLIFYTGKEIDESYVSHEFDSKDLLEIYIGCRVNLAEQKVILKCLSDEKYNHVKIYRLNMDQQKFILNPCLIKRT